MRIRNLVFTLALGVTGCAGLPPPFNSFANPLNVSTVSTVNASWGGALALAANYRDACANRLIPPSCRPIVVKMQQYAIAPQAAVKAVNKATVGGSTNVVALAQAASDAVNDYKTLQMQYGIH